MDDSNYLLYSAQEPMIALRKKFNNGETVYKTVPDFLTEQEAMADILYVRYVLENAYSGYSYFDKDLFDNAFDLIMKSISGRVKIKPNELIDVIHSRLSFISDGHLSFSTQNYGKGFYKKQQTYVSEIVLTKRNNKYFESVSGKEVSFDDTVRAFPTVGADAENTFLIGVRSKECVETITIQLDGETVSLPVHKIASRKITQETLIEEHYIDHVAIITCSSFVGDSEMLKQQFYDVGKKCRQYKHVIWDLSNNLGGNSDLPKKFLSGLTGGFADTLSFLELKSALVHAKEFGEIRDVSYHFESKCDSETKAADLFSGELHVIINDMVASSAEIAIAWADSLKRVTFYGCNSLGIGRFGDLCIYYLPHSQIVLWCPQKVFDTNIAETVGFEPDYWIDKSDVASIVLSEIHKYSAC